MNLTEPLYTVKETAALLKLNPFTIYAYIKRGTLRAIRFGRYFRILQTDLDNFIHNHTYET